MQTSLMAVQILVAVVLIGVLLLQVKGATTGIFGAAESSFRARRGLEKILFQFTVGLVVLFVVLAVVAIKTS